MTVLSDPDFHHCDTLHNHILPQSIPTPVTIVISTLARVSGSAGIINERDSVSTQSLPHRFHPLDAAIEQGSRIRHVSVHVAAGTGRLRQLFSFILEGFEVLGGAHGTRRSLGM